jgi:hypothetical protein
MMSADFEKLLSDFFRVSRPKCANYGTRLRKAKLLSRNEQSPHRGVHLNFRDAAMWIIAMSIDHEYNESLATEVRRVSNLPIKETTLFPPGGMGLTYDFSWSGPTFGAALGSVIRDVRSLDDDSRDTLGVSIEAGGTWAHVSLHCEPGPEFRAGQWTFERGQRVRPPVERTVNLAGEMLRTIGRAIEP